MHYNSDATAALVLKKITPVIRALFDPFGLQPMDEGTAFIQWYDHEGGDDDGETCGEWVGIYGNLIRLAHGLGLKVEPAPGDMAREDDDDKPFVVPPVFDTLMTHFKVAAAQREAIHRILIEANNGEGHQDWLYSSAQFDDLLMIATALNDGHGLQSIACECVTVGSRPAINGYYGTATFYSVQFGHASNTSYQLEWAEKVRKAIATKKLDEATNLLASNVIEMLDGITNPTVRSTLTKDLIAALQASAA